MTRRRSPLGRCAARLQASAPPQSCATSAASWPPSGSISAAMSADEVLGAIGLDLGRRRRSLVAAQVGRDAAIAVGEMLEQLVPDERRLREAVQEHEHRRAAPAGGTAAELDAVAERLDVGSRSAGVAPMGPGGSSTRAASSTPARLSDENGVSDDVALLAGHFAEDFARGLQRRVGVAPVQLVDLGQQRQQLHRCRCRARGATKSSSLRSMLGEAEPRIDAARRSRSGCAAPRGTRPSPPASAAWRCARPRRSRSRAGRRTARRRRASGRARTG